MSHPLPPPLEKPPSREQLGQLARELLREMAQHDAGLAQRLRDEEIDLED